MITPSTQEDVGRILTFRKGGHVQRFHQYPIHGDASVARHTFQMLNLLFLLHPNPWIGLVKAITYHDCPFEFLLGDIPGNTKAKNALVRAGIETEERKLAIHLKVPGFDEELSDDEKRWLKALDCLDGLLFCDEQLLMGNKNLANVRANYFAALHGTNGELKPQTDVPPQVTQFLDVYDRFFCPF